MPLVSIVIPTYNRAELISATIRSIQDSDFSDWECVVVDDGSNDGTWGILESLVQSDPRIRRLRREQVPKGACTCRNIGWRASVSDYVLFLDSDDLLHRETLKNFQLQRQDGVEYDFCVFGYAKFLEEEDLQRDLPIHLGDDSVPDLLRFLKHENPWMTGSVIWSKKFLAVLGGWNEEISQSQDWEIHCRALLLEPKYTKIEKVGYFWRVDDERPRISNGVTRNYVEARLLCVRSVRLAAGKIENREVNRLLCWNYFRVQIRCIENGLNARAWATFREMTSTLCIGWTLRLGFLLLLAVVRIKTGLISKLRLCANWFIERGEAAFFGERMKQW